MTAPSTKKPPAPSSPAQKAEERRARRHIAGVTVPLFSLRGERSWGIGEIGDIPAFAEWIAGAGVRLVQLLPLGEIAGAETSPYFALSAFGIDPMYISIADLPDLPENDISWAIGGDTKLLAAVRARAEIDYVGVRALKNRALRFAFD